MSESREQRWYGAKQQPAVRAAAGNDGWVLLPSGAWFWFESEDPTSMVRVDRNAVGNMSDPADRWYKK